MRIVLTGGSSFTGFWFARSLVEAGHDVTVTLTGRDASLYEGIRATRVSKLREVCKVKFDSPFGSDSFLSVLSDHPDVLCHHWSEARDYGSSDFDTMRAVAANVRRIVDVLRTFKRSGGCRLVLTGSVTEPNEGAGTLPLRGFWPYSLAKAITADVCSYYCDREGIEFGKFVIPNPFGPLEEPRFTDYLLRTWFDGNVASVQTPRYVRDNIHVDLLAKAYVSHVTEGEPRPKHFGPSGYVESQGAFAQRVAHEMRKRLPLECALKLETQTDFSQPLIRINTDGLGAVETGWSETEAWDALASYYDSKYAH